MAAITVTGADRSDTFSIFTVIIGTSVRLLTGAG